MKKRNRGRPKKEDGMIRSKRVNILLSDAELEKFSKAAEELGIPISRLMRNAVALQHEYFDSPNMYKKF